MNGTGASLMRRKKKKSRPCFYFQSRVLSSIANSIVAHQLAPQAESEPSHPLKGNTQISSTRERTHTHTPFCTYPSAKNLVDSCAFFQSTLCYNVRSHFFHVQHESIQRFLNMRSFWLLFFSLFVLRLPKTWWGKGEGGKKSIYLPSA